MLLDKDTQLMLQLAGGDNTAYDELYQKYFPAIVSYLKKSNKCQISPEDLAQEVFMRLWERRRFFRADSSAKTYIFSIAINLVREYNRIIHKQRDLLQQLGTSSTHCEHHLNTDKSLHSHKLAKNIGHAKSRLSAKQRQAIEMVVCDGIPPAIAAKLAGCSSGTLRHRVYDAKNRLLELME